MWNQVGSECKLFRIRKVNLALRSYQPSSSYAHMRFSAGMYMSSGSWFQRYPELSHTNFMWIQPRCSVCSSPLYVLLTLKECPHLVLPFFKPVRTSLSPIQFFAYQSQDKGPCFPMSKPHSAHLLGELLTTKSTSVQSLTLRVTDG